MATTSIPRLAGPRTAYEVLTEDIVGLIREEPRRMRMTVWQMRSVRDLASELESVYETAVDNDDDVEVPDDLFERAEELMPACGMVGCIGGWTEAVCGVDPSFDTHMGGKAAGLLGLDQEQTDDLMYPDDLMDRLDEGTPEYAEEVVRHIMAFAARHEAQLRAKVVVPGDGGAP